MTEKLLEINHNPQMTWAAQTKKTCMKHRRMVDFSQSYHVYCVLTFSCVINLKYRSCNTTHSLTWIPSTVQSTMTYLHAEEIFRVLRTCFDALSIIINMVEFFFFKCPITCIMTIVSGRILYTARYLLHASPKSSFPARRIFLLSHTTKLSILNFDRVIIERHRRLLWWVPALHSLTEV